MHGLPLIRHCAWLGAKLAFASLAAIVIAFWLWMIGFIAYKSIQLGVSPLAIIHAFDNQTLRSLLYILLGLVWGVIVGTAFCTAISAGIGAVAAVVKRVRGTSTQATI